MSSQPSSGGAEEVFVCSRHDQRTLEHDHGTRCVLLDRFSFCSVALARRAVPRFMCNTFSTMPPELRQLCTEAEWRSLRARSRSRLLRLHRQATRAAFQGDHAARADLIEAASNKLQMFIAAAQKIPKGIQRRQPGPAHPPAPRSSSPLLPQFARRPAQRPLNCRPSQAHQARRVP